MSQIIHHMPLEHMQALLAESSSDNELILLGQSIGAANLLQVLEILGGAAGCEIYVPSPARFIKALAREFRDKDICQHYQHGQAHLWAKKYNISEDRVRKIVKKYAKDTTA